jgi:hypothetical protein
MIYLILIVITVTLYEILRYKGLNRYKVIKSLKSYKKQLIISTFYWVNHRNCNSIHC